MAGLDQITCRSPLSGAARSRRLEYLSKLPARPPCFASDSGPETWTSCWRIASVLSDRLNFQLFTIREKMKLRVSIMKQARESKCRPRKAAVRNNITENQFNASVSWHVHFTTQNLDEGKLFQKWKTYNKTNITRVMFVRRENREKHFEFKWGLPLKLRIRKALFGGLNNIVIICKGQIP